MAKDFRSKKRNRPGIEFSIEGETFTTVGGIPAGAANDIMAGITLDEHGNRVYSAPNLFRFITAVLRENRLVTVEQARLEEAIEQDEEPPDSAVEWLTFDEARDLGIPTASVGEDDTRDGRLRAVRISTDDVRRFENLVYGKDVVVEIDVIADAFVYIIEELSGRPFQPSVVSRPGRG